MKKLTILLLFAVSCYALHAQQFAFYTQFQNNWQVINPAAPHITFFQNKFTASVVNIAYRQQWIGTQGSPANYNVHFETMERIGGRSKFKTKWGFGLYGETAGVLLNNTLYGNYAYPINLSGRRSGVQNKLYVGFNAGYMRQRINFGAINFKDGLDETTIQAFIDPQKLFRGNFFEFTPGVLFTNSENFYVGASSPRLILTGKTANTLKTINPKPQVHLIAGIYNDHLMTIQPSIWVRWQSSIDYQTLIANLPLSISAHFRSQLSKSLALGLGLSTGKWAHLESSWYLGKSKRGMNSANTETIIHFAYDLPFGKTTFQLGQSAEMGVNIIFKQ